MIADGSNGRDGRSPAVVLRHDLIGPVSQILGYSELLIGEAEESGRVYRTQGLRSIQARGKQLLGAIDGILLSDPDRPADLEALAAGVFAPTRAIIESCHALEEASAEVPDREGFLEDLARVRDAASLLVAMASEAKGTPAAASG